MNRDILLGVLLSLVLHGFVLFSALRGEQKTMASTPPPPAKLDLSIIRTSMDPQKPFEGDPTQKANRTITSPPPVPLRPPADPDLPQKRQMVSRSLPTKRIGQAEATVNTLGKIRKDEYVGRIPTLKPIQNARAILKRMEPEDLSPGSEKTPIPRAGQESILGTDVPLHRISSPSNRRDGSRKAPITRDPRTWVPSPAKPFIKLTEPLPRTEGGAGEQQEAYAPIRERPRTTEAVPDYTSNPKPVYPKRAILRGYEGTVTLLAEVLTDGSVGEVTILESSGYRILDRSALKAVRSWQFRPGSEDGRPVTMKVKVPVVFRLKGNPRG
jgi:TonB family protein